MDNTLLKLHDDVAEAIRKTLPEVAANELKKFIEQAQRTDIALRNCMGDLDKSNARIAQLEKQLNEHRGLDEKLKEIETKTKDLEARELKLVHATAANTAAVAQGQLATAMEVMGLVFRNQTISQKVLGTLPVSVEGQQPNQYNSCGSPGYVGQGTVDQTVETTTK